MRAPLGGARHGPTCLPDEQLGTLLGACGGAHAAAQALGNVWGGEVPVAPVCLAGHLQGKMNGQEDMHVGVCWC